MLGHQVIFAGNVGSDVAIRNIDGGRQIAEFSFAQEVNPGPNEDKRVNWYQIECWDKLAEKISGSSYARTPNLTPDDGQIKGARVIISGWIHIREWRDDDNNLHKKPVIVADEIAFSCFYGAVDVIKRNTATSGKKEKKS